jgi:hypothetical protein
MTASRNKECAFASLASLENLVRIEYAQNLCLASLMSRHLGQILRDPSAVDIWIDCTIIHYVLER